MRYTPIEPPRTFEVGVDGGIEMKDCARIELAPDEQVTFVTASGAEYDVARKDFGFYATPSLNGRLRDFGLRAVLVRNGIGRYFVLLVERDREGSFQRYLEHEQQTLVRWLDSGETLSSLEGPPQEQGRHGAATCCAEGGLEVIHEYTRPPTGETRYALTDGRPYRRRLLRCRNCGHFLSQCDLALEEMYAGEYASATYGARGIPLAYERIMSLPRDRSDNAGRVRRVNELVQRFAPRGGRRLLDVGSGLCVFAACMKQAGWTCTVVDPDPRAAEHARRVVGVEALAADFRDLNGLGRFDLVTFNKVLEHVDAPAAMLAHSAGLLAPGGLVYIELPDGPSAFSDPAGPLREEFFIEHRQVFSVASTDLLARAAGFETLLIERLREPSGKYTIRALLRTTEDRPA